MIVTAEAAKKATKAGEGMRKGFIRKKNATFSSSAIERAMEILKKTDWEKMGRYLPKRDAGIIKN